MAFQENVGIEFFMTNGIENVVLLLALVAKTVNIQVFWKNSEFLLLSEPCKQINYLLLLVALKH